MQTWVNALTAVRGLCGPVVAGLLLAGLNKAGFWLFLFAILTDLVDGRLAKLAGGDNPVGRMLDPAADKMLTDTVWVALWWVGWGPTWLVAGCLARDLFAGYLWWRGVREVSPAAQVGIAFEGVALCVLLFHGPWLGVHWPSVGTVCGAIALGLFLASLPQYWQDGRRP
ncbi:MAG: CDP-alcohol phosphatidyltransferase family protein [Alphaproteobacteria bacterium]|nr:CDP-alcohol phosphatidyltransferase family protein [Alphaproteobacteria bacterium]